MHAWDQGDPKRGEAPLKVRLRDAHAGDDADMQRLWRELMELHVDVDPRFDLSENADEAFLSYADTARNRDDYRVRLAEVDGDTVGFSISCILPNSPVYRTRWIGYINDLCVTSTMRRRGIGELLVNDAYHWLKDNGADTVEVYVARLNEGAQRFWRSVGGREYLDRMSIEPPGSQD